MNFVFLALAPLLLPLIFQIDKKIFNGGNFKAIFGASLVSLIIFSVIAIIQHWVDLLYYSINETSNIFFKDIPLEQYVLNFSFSFAAVSLYQYLNVRFPKNDLQKYSLAISNLLLGLCIAFLFFAFNKWYTLSTFATLLVLLLLIEYVGRLRFMYRAYRAFLVMLIPFHIIYGVLYWNGIIAVAKDHVSGMYIARIPVENHFVTLSMMLLSIYMFEFFKTKQKA